MHAQDGGADDFWRFLTEPDQPSMSQPMSSQGAGSGSTSKADKGNVTKKGKDKSNKIGKKNSSRKRSAKPTIRIPSQHHSLVPPPVFFDSIQQAEAFREPRAPFRIRKDVGGQQIADDVHSVCDKQRNHVRSLLVVMSDLLTGKVVAQPANWSKKEAEALWIAWQNEEVDNIEAKIESGDQYVKRMVAARVWTLIKEVIAIHLNGTILGCDFDNSLTCTDRMEALIGIVADYTSVRRDLVNFDRPFLSVHALAASPHAYTRRKIGSFWQRAEDEGYGAIVKQTAKPQGNEATESDPYDGPRSDDDEEQSGGAEGQPSVERGSRREKRKSRKGEKGRQPSTRQRRTQREPQPEGSPADCQEQVSHSQHPSSKQQRRRQRHRWR